MEESKESPTRQEPMQGLISFDEEQGNDMNKIYNCLSNRQKKVFDLLCTGKQSVTDITEIRSCETLSLGEILDSPAFNNTRYGRR